MKSGMMSKLAERATPRFRPEASSTSASGKLIRFDEEAKFVFVRATPMLPTVAGETKADRAAAATRLDAAFTSVGAPVVEVKDDAVCIRQPWAFMEDRIIRITRGGGLYLCTGAGGADVAQSIDLRRVVSAAQLFFVRVTEVEKEDSQNLEEDAALLKRMRLQAMNQFLSRNTDVASAVVAAPISAEREYCRHDDPMRTGLALIAKPLGAADHDSRRDYYPFIFASRQQAATFLRIVQTVLRDLGVPFGEAEETAQQSGDKADGQVPDGAEEGVETGTKQLTETSASLLLDMLEGSSEEDEDAEAATAAVAEDMNEFELDDVAAKQRDATIAQNMISRVTSLQEMIVGPFRFIGTSGVPLFPEDRHGEDRGSALSVPPPQQDALPVMEAINARQPEYYNKEGMHAFMGVCASLYRGVTRERRMEACTAIVHIRTMVGALKYLRTTATQQIALTWERRRVLRRYQMQHYILDLQKYVASLHASINSERELLGRELEAAAAAIMTPPVRENPLTRLTGPADVAAMGEDAQISFEGEYMAFLHDEAARLEAQLAALRELAADQEVDVDRGLRSYEMRLSNVFPDNVTSRLRMNV
jgi:hypothetical protein